MTLISVAISIPELRVWAEQLIVDAEMMQPRDWLVHLMAGVACERADPGGARMRIEKARRLWRGKAAQFDKDLTFWRQHLNPMTQK